MKVRPICVGESLLRLAATLALSRTLEGLKTRFAELQLALADGCVERGIHKIRELYDGGYVVVALDARNAFNTLRRSVPTRR